MENGGPVLRHFHRVLRPGAPLLLGFHAGDESTLKSEGYGGHPTPDTRHSALQLQLLLKGDPKSLKQLEMAPKFKNNPAAVEKARKIKEGNFP